MFDLISFDSITRKESLSPSSGKLDPTGVGLCGGAGSEALATHASPILELPRIEATKPQPFPSSTSLPHGAGTLRGSLQPCNLGPRHCWRMKPITPSPPTRRELGDRQMKGVCAAPQPPTCYLNSPPDKVGSLSWHLPPGLPFMRLEVLLPVSGGWREKKASRRGGKKSREWGGRGTRQH